MENHDYDLYLALRQSLTQVVQKLRDGEDVDEALASYKPVNEQATEVDNQLATR